MSVIYNNTDGRDNIFEFSKRQEDILVTRCHWQRKKESWREP
jgi:hypothetical protein